jgi:menaquinone-dependent protoporphyrinogen oxidase
MRPQSGVSLRRTVMKRRVLITYGTRLGSTREVAEAMGEIIRQQGASVDVLETREVSGIDGYSAVIIGTAIRGGKPVPEVTRFVEDHSPTLWKIPVAYFVVCMTLREDTPQNRQIVDHYLDPLREIVPATDVALLAGRLDQDRLPFLRRFMMRATHSPQGDWRDWGAIRHTALRFHELLVATAEPV